MTDTSPQPSTQNIVKNIIDGLDQRNADCFVYSGPMNRSGVELFRETIASIERPREEAILYLTTYGGDAHAAYRMMRALRRRYNKITLAVFGTCASAGTLAALGADEIVMDEFGEFGPLDVQMPKQDELFQRNSGLDIFQALVVLTDQAFGAFESYFLETLSKSGGTISARTAMENARELTVGLFSPISAQIDPLRLGEMHRAMNIARAYGNDLGQKNVKPDAVEQLISGYPAHEFVIDIDGASKLFNTVRLPNKLEYIIAHAFTKIVGQPCSQVVQIDVKGTLQGALPPVGSTNNDQSDQGGDDAASGDVHKAASASEGDSDGSQQDPTSDEGDADDAGTVHKLQKL